MQAKMRQLGTTWFNLLPERMVIYDDQPNAPLGRQVIDSEQLDEPQNVGQNTIDHLFGDIAFYMGENFMGEMDPKQQSQIRELHKKLKDMHILDKLDYLENKRANNIPMQ